jgi:hypothetical protein
MVRGGHVIEHNEYLTINNVAVSLLERDSFRHKDSQEFEDVIY